MMDKGLSPDDCADIVAHMNDDHADALVLYAKVFAGIQDATATQMLDIDATGMNLEVESGDKIREIRIEFDRVLEHAGDARRILREMAEFARSRRAPAT